MSSTMPTSTERASQDLAIGGQQDAIRTRRLAVEWQIGVRPAEWAAWLLAIIAIAAVVVPKLPLSICFDDAGDFQLAAATLGIAHPPGYPIYVTLAFPVTLIPGVDPAYAVSVLCLMVGLAALSFAWLLQVQLGVNAWVAGATIVALAGHRRVWMNLNSPEVYIWSIAFTLGGILLALIYARTGRLRYALAAALTLGAAIISRPPIVLSVPFFLVAWWLIERRRGHCLRDSLGRLRACMLIALLPACYSFAYLFLRDRPETRHNFIYDQNLESRELPEASEGVGAKLKRVYWQASAKMFRRYLGDTWGGIRGKLRWAWMNLELETPGATLALGFLVICGLVLAFRHAPPVAWCLVGISLPAFGYLLVYRIHGQAADLLPVVMVCGILAALATKSVLPRGSGGGRGWIAAAIFVGVLGWSIQDARGRPHGERTRGASQYVRDADVGGMPQGSVICAVWRSSVPLKYASLVMHDRADIIVFAADPDNWFRVTEPLKDRTIFVDDHHPLLEHCEVVPRGSLWKWDRAHCEERKE